jgi:hypothetical protein
MQGKHLFDERAAEVEQRHVETEKVIGHVIAALLQQEATNHRCDRYNFCRKRSALNTRL